MKRFAFLLATALLLASGGSARAQGVEEARDLTIVSDMIVNVQTGTGNRIEFWNRVGTPLKSRGKIRRFIDVGRLTRGR